LYSSEGRPLKEVVDFKKMAQLGSTDLLKQLQATSLSDPTRLAMFLVKAVKNGPPT